VNTATSNECNNDINKIITVDNVANRSLWPCVNSTCKCVGSRTGKIGHPVLQVNACVDWIFFSERFFCTFVVDILPFHVLHYVKLFLMLNYDEHVELFTVQMRIFLSRIKIN
jgi:hypothetical protein